MINGTPLLDRHESMQSPASPLVTPNLCLTPETLPPNRDALTMLDWITAKLPQKKVPRLLADHFKHQGHKILKVDQQTGEIVWETACWNRIQSGSHSLSVRLDNRGLWIKGSPARCEGDGCNVFGGPVSRSLNISACLQLMIRELRRHSKLPLPDCSCWKVTRVDVTRNALLSDKAAVMRALGLLERAEIGRRKVTHTVHTSVYWNKGSQHRSGKAYAKGPQLRNDGKKVCTGRKCYSNEELAKADRLLRLELQLGSRFFGRYNSWQDITPEELDHQWEDFFMGMIGTTEVTSNSVLERLSEVAGSKQLARAVYGTWTLIRELGRKGAMEQVSKATWHRHINVLKKIGIGGSDIGNRKVIELRREPLVLAFANGWGDLLRA